MSFTSTPEKNDAIRDEVQFITLIIWIIAIFFGVFTFLQIKLCIADLLHPTHPLELMDWLAPVLLTAMDLLLFAAAAYSTVLRKKFGRSTLELSIPPAIGGKFAGAIVTGKPIRFTSNLHITLTCMKIQGYRGNGSDALWQDELILTNQIPTGSTGTRIPIYFEIPPRCSPTQHKSALIRWHLSIHSPMPGVDYYAKFTIPVLKVHQEETEIADLTQPYRTTESHPDSSPPKIDTTGSEIHFPAARHPLVALENTAFAIAFVAAPFALAYYGLSHTASLIFSILFGLITLFIAIDAWGMWFCFGRLSLQEKSLDLTRGQFFFSRTIHLDASDITQVKVRRTRESGPSTWYALELHTSLPKHRLLTIADGLSRRDADRCATRIKSISGTHLTSRTKMR